MLYPPSQDLLTVPRLTASTVIDILVVAFLIYQFIMIVRGRRSANILVGLAVLALVYLVAVYAHLELLRTVLATLAPYTIFALIVMFQSDIRRLLAQIGLRRLFTASQQLHSYERIAEIVLALGMLSQRKTGALIVLEKDVGLRTFVESGLHMDATLSRDLLLSIFQSGGALHDGAVIVQGDRVAAAACFLPLSLNPEIMSKLGTRHRAAIGITEESDALAVVVSEETGRISIAAFGKIELDVTRERLEQRLTQHFSGRRGRPTSAPLSADSHFEGDTEAEYKEAGRHR